MNKWPIEKLNALSKDLDFFEEHTIVDPQLLNFSLYCPVSLSGNFLVHGFALLEQAKAGNISELSVIELPAMEKKQMVSLALKREARGGHYSWTEVERIMNFLSSPDEVDNFLITLIAGHDDSHFLEKWIDYRSYSLPLKQCINEEIIDFKTAQKISSLPSGVFTSILDYKNSHRISFSEIRIFLTTLYEISRRDSLTEQAVEEICRSLLAEDHPVEGIKKIRYPELTGMYEDFKSVRDSLVKAKGVTLTEPPFFEGNSFKVEFYFQSKQQLEKRIKVLKNLQEKADELFKLL
ncbi:MAG: hypothetical protein JXJ04_09700 [Spirochaetales bacterium]|nr:hypothetical protein [Spirochaetales bacterium]